MAEAKPKTIETLTLKIDTADVAASVEGLTAFVKAYDAFAAAVGETNARLAPNLDGWMTDLRNARAAINV